MKLTTASNFFFLLVSLFIASTALAKEWKGAEIITQETFKYGAFEARIRGAEGSGMITAFFMWKNGSELTGTEWQEQDFELFGSTGNFQTQLMMPGDPRTEHKLYHPSPTPIWDDYYTYRMEWTPDYLAFYVDGRLIRKETDPVRFGKILDPSRAEPMQMRLSMWAGDFGWSGDFDESKVPAAVFVEYANVYAYTPGAGEEGADFTPIWKDDFDALDTSRWWFANWTFEWAVNDYVRDNAAVINGKLVLALTHWENQGQFPLAVPDDNPIVEIGNVGDGVYIPSVVPGRVEAEVTSDYFDLDSNNRGSSACGSSGVDATLTTDAGGGCYVGWTNLGEWLEYEIEVLEAGTFEFVARAATARGGSVFHLELNGVDITGPISVNASGWEVFADYSASLELEEGLHTMRVVFDSPGVNLNYIDILERSSVDAGDDGEEEVSRVVVKVEAERFSDAFDLSVGNRGSDSCGTGDVDSQITSDIGGGCNIGWTQSGEWLEYEVDVPAGTYELSLRVATFFPGVTYGLEIDGSAIALGVEVPQGGWQEFSDVSTTVVLGGGQHSIRVLFETDNTNFNYFTLTLLDAEGESSSSAVSSAVTEESSSFSSSSVSEAFFSSEMSSSLSEVHSSSNSSSLAEESSSSESSFSSGSGSSSLQDVQSSSSLSEVSSSPISSSSVGESSSAEVLSSSSSDSSSSNAVCESVRVEAESMDHSTGGAVAGGWNIWSNGTAFTEMELDQGDITVVVRAHGTFANGEWPNMNLRVGGDLVGSVTVNSAGYEEYLFQTSVFGGSEVISVEFDNDYYQDGEDRNLIVDAIIVEQCN